MHCMPTPAVLSIFLCAGLLFGVNKWHNTDIAFSLSMYSAILFLLKDREWVLSEKMVKNLTMQMERISTLSKAMSDLPNYAGNSALSYMMKQIGTSKTVNNVTNNRPIEVNIGDMIIQGADQSTIEKHVKITRDMVNQIGRIIGIGR